VFFRREHPRVVRSMVLIVGNLDLAGELAQEAMARTLIDWDELEDDEHALRFVLRVAANLARPRWSA
jgi:DNA-directed RNA polymerase specialized sigma24 family protein